VCEDGRSLGFQEYFVRERTEPAVARVTFEGAARAVPAPGVVAAIDAADRVILCPSNPLLSIAPILALPGLREALRAHPAVYAVTPIIAGSALKGPADRLLERICGESSAAAVARLYADFCDTFVFDSSDETQGEEVAAAGVGAAALDTLMRDADASTRLAAELVAL
jgi:LPPG:FO 2-phospho-L-lactate transferase